MAKTRMVLPFSTGGGVTQAPSLLPLTISANGRFFTLQDGTPFLMVADDCWGGAIESLADFTYYVQQRAQEGYNAIQFSLIVNAYIGGTDPDYPTRDGITPFTGSKPDTPNPVYFARMDQFIDALAANNMIAIVNAYPCDSTIVGDLTSAGATKCYNYGVYLANRWASRKNVVWWVGNDYTTVSTSDTMVQNIYQGFIDTTPNILRLGELSKADSSNDTTSFDKAAFHPPYTQANGAYTYRSPYVGILKAYNTSSTNFGGFGAGTNLSPVSPAYLQEVTYEFEDFFGQGGTPLTIRNEAWWTFCYGACGYFTGNFFTDTTFRISDTPPVGGYNATTPRWKNNLNSTQTQHLIICKHFFESVAWWRLVPDQTHVVGTAGYGTAQDNVTWGSDAFITVGAAAAGDLAVAYFPLGSASTLTVDMTKFRGPVTGQWFDPTSAAYSSVSGSPFSNSGTHNFNPTGNNAAGDPDWVLLLQA